MDLLSRAAAALTALVILGVAGCGGGGGTPVEPAPPATERATAFGTVVGTDDSAASGTYSWKGVPYAKAPVGALRWKPAVNPEPWTAKRDARSFASACVQSGRLYGPGSNNRYDATIGATLGTTLGSEDCLYLNIWAPAGGATGAKPVIVWVHGGSNITGYTADPVYDGANLARTADAVVVSMNYRLGIFGWLNVSQLRTGDPLTDSGDFAMLDLIHALRFVQRNIAGFGGDPGKVTLMGQSAGSVNVLALMTSPVVTATRPQLFHRLVELSGGISTAATIRPGGVPSIVARSIYGQQGDALVAAALVADGTAVDTAAAQVWIAARTPAEVAAYLRGKSPDALLSLVRGPLTALGLSGSNPIADGNVLPVDPIAAIRAGNYLKVPVLAGITRDEVKLFPSLLTWLGAPNGRLLTDAQVFDIAYDYDPDGPPTTTVGDWIHPFYLPVTDPTTGFNLYTDFLNQYWFIEGRNDLLNSLQMQQTGIWHYQFDWDELPAPFNDIFGAAHAFDLPFLFGNFEPSLYAKISFTQANRPGRLALSNAMMKSLGAFARTGDPNHPSLGVAWPQWPAKLILDASPAATNITVQ